MEKSESIAMEVLHSVKKDKEFLTKILFISLIVNTVLAIVIFIKK